MKTLIVIVGPTGVGKTELCLKVAEAFGTVIVNADSRQIFKEIPVGTAAPTIAERRRIRHFLSAICTLTNIIMRQCSRMTLLRCWILF